MLLNTNAASTAIYCSMLSNHHDTQHLQAQCIKWRRPFCQVQLQHEDGADRKSQRKSCTSCAMQHLLLTDDKFACSAYQPCVHLMTLMTLMT
jgi:hypothetical protein